mgnify:CR=1 FL=1
MEILFQFSVVSNSDIVSKRRSDSVHKTDCMSHQPVGDTVNKQGMTTTGDNDLKSDPQAWYSQPDGETSSECSISKSSCLHWHSFLVCGKLFMIPTLSIFDCPFITRSKVMKLIGI